MEAKLKTKIVLEKIHELNATMLNAVNRVTMTAMGTKLTFLWNPQEVCFTLVSGQPGIQRHGATNGQLQTSGVCITSRDM